MVDFPQMVLIKSFIYGLHPPHFSGAPIVNNLTDQLDKIRLVIVLKFEDFREKNCTYKISLWQDRRKLKPE